MHGWGSTAHRKCVLECVDHLSVEVKKEEQNPHGNMLDQGKMAQDGLIFPLKV